MYHLNWNSVMQPGPDHKYLHGSSFDMFFTHLQQSYCYCFFYLHDRIKQISFGYTIHLVLYMKRVKY